jgi:hypothetical protein
MIIGCDLHTANQTIALLDRDTGEVVEHMLNHDGETVRAFYSALPKPAGGGHRSHGRDGLVRAVTGGAGNHLPTGARGGLAEWSMAVVLKTSRIGYDVAVIFCGVVPSSDPQHLAIIVTT